MSDVFDDELRFIVMQFQFHFGMILLQQCQYFIELIRLEERIIAVAEKGG